MPTKTHTRYKLAYDLGEAYQRGVTQRYSSLKRDLKDVLGSGVPRTHKEVRYGRAIILAEIVLAHSSAFSHSETLEVEDIVTALELLQEIEGFRAIEKKEEYFCT